MPVPAARDDLDYFRPLADLEIGSVFMWAAQGFR
jgi:hypothetical protein